MFAFSHFAPLLLCVKKGVIKSLAKILATPMMVLYLKLDWIHLEKESGVIPLKSEGYEICKKMPLLKRRSFQKLKNVSLIGSC
jgi:hypothetical protein